MEIGCVGSSSTTSRSSRPPSSRQSSRPSSGTTSSQASSRQSNVHVGRPRSALNSAYGALRKLVSRKGSDRSRTIIDTGVVTSNGSVHDHRGLPAPLLESDSSSNEEKLKRQCRNRYDRPSSKGTESQRSRTSTSHSPTDKTNKRPQGIPKKDVNGEPVGGGLSQTIARHKQRQRDRHVRETSQSSSNESMLNDLSDADVLAAKGIMLKRKLGEGTYAKVRSGYHTRLQRPGYVAIKIISRETTNMRYQMKFLPRERAILDQVRHKNIIRLHETFECGQKVFMVMELANQGDLLEHIQRRRVLSDDRSRYIFSQIIDGVEYLHLNGIFHRDLKCENILLNSGYKVKISDFGFAREWREAHALCRTFCGSAAYASPEILQGIPYDPHVADIWSLGVILFIMITGTMPYDDSDVKNMLEVMAHNRLDFPRKRVVCIEVKELLHSILYYFHRDRATLLKIRHSSWMRGHCTLPKVETTPVAQTSVSASKVQTSPKGAEAGSTTATAPVGAKPREGR